MDNQCRFCSEKKRENLYNRGGRKICSLCMKVIIETVQDYVKT